MTTTSNTDSTTTGAAPTVSKLSDSAAEAAVTAGAKALGLPTIRDHGMTLAAAAAKQRLTHKAFLAETLTAECDERDARRRMRRVNEAKFPRTKRLTDFEPPGYPTCPPPRWPTSPKEAGSMPVNHSCYSATPAPEKPTSSSRSAPPPPNKAAASATPPPPHWSTNSPKQPTTNNSPES